MNRVEEEQVLQVAAVDPLIEELGTHSFQSCFSRTVFFFFLVDVAFFFFIEQDSSVASSPCRVEGEVGKADGHGLKLSILQSFTWLNFSYSSAISIFDKRKVL